MMHDGLVPVVESALHFRPNRETIRSSIAYDSGTAVPVLFEHFYTGSPGCFFLHTRFFR